MGIVRDMQSVKILTDSGKTNQYNEKRIEYKFIKTVEMAIYLNSQSNTDDFRYVQAEYVGLSGDKTLDDGMIVSAGNNIKYEIVLANPYGRLAQYYLKRVE